MSSGHAHSGVKLGDHEVDQALANPAIRRRLARTPRVDRSWDIAYLGGYSEDGRTIFLDRHLPKKFEYYPRKFTFRRISLDEFLLLHEEVEKALIDELGFKYAHAHEVATRAEEKAVRAASIDVDWYRKVLRPFIKADEVERLLRVPGNLDTKPYHAPPVDKALLGRITDAQAYPGPAGKIPPTDAGYHDGHGPHGQHCGICGYFSRPHGCTVVARRVDENAGCRYFTKAYQPEEHAHA